MEVTNILDEITQIISENTISTILSREKYRKEENIASQHLEWLEEHLNEEEKAHLEEYRSAELALSTIENETYIRTALAVGIRLALPC